MNRSAIKSVLIALSFALGAAAFADDTDRPLLQLTQQPQASKKPGEFVRTDSLEMPGVTACHQCEWRPKPNNMDAGAQCGMGVDGKARSGEFECGFSEDCHRVCNFVRCLNA